MKLPPGMKPVFAEACLLLGFSRLLLWKLSFRSIAGRLGEAGRETKFSNADIDLRKVRQVSIAIRTMSRYTPWKNNCLVQAYAAKLMLNRRKLKSTVYLGVARNESGSMIAHAWLRCGEFYVTGGNGGIKYTVTGKFA
jgi:hypothetical protein